ncbi:hypothetical protein LAZ67_6003838 [Cordylochernes scorpioides]|uniref:Uncharacterized protein n=1 Tax=Cordylochernes scorpioides TaxID=51811 RepID=A0ABY6KMC3_9ARAC|nr:hypothetical protein LAZ67_6003838 [Cordylochernes scorpioides]
MNSSSARKFLTPFQEEWNGRSEKRDREIETRTRRRTPSSQKPEKAAKLQRSYNINKKHTMQKILGQRSPGCTIPIQRIENHFEKHMVGDNIGFSPDPDLLKEFAPKNGAQLEESISSNELPETEMDGSQCHHPHPDLPVLLPDEGGTPFMDGKLLDLAPQERKHDDLGNWRPIALGNTSAKLYTAVLDDRLRRWAATTGQLSKAQKGSMEIEGCLEHNFVLQSAIEETKRTSRLASPGWTSEMHSARYRMNTSSMG